MLVRDDRRVKGNSTLIEIDGSLGEGGGQVLRSALTLSLLVQKPFRIRNIRGRRKNPGLRAQHLASVQAAAAVGEAQLKGDQLNSQELTFRPSGLKAGEYRFEIGTAGSCSLVLQTIFLPLALAGSRSELVITGGTHVAWSPTYDYVDRVWLPALKLLGYPAEIRMPKAGFYPKGGGRIEVSVSPGRSGRGFNPDRESASSGFTGVSLSSNLPEQVAERQRRRMLEKLEASGLPAQVEVLRPGSVGRGSAVLIAGSRHRDHFGFSALGAKGKPAETVADEAIDQLLSFLRSDAQVDRYLADQLLIPLSVAGEASQFSVERATQHLSTNAEIVRQFLDAEISISEPNEGGRARVQVKPAPEA